ncbi:MAG: transketolase [Dissulfurimicrobium sp.]|uniref:transketolase n=1 Tax=Dissulfurimicrobium TaxID=1769732 RepID=UPI003C792B89
MSTRKKMANAIRVLSMDAIEKAKSGHPGTPLGMADIAEVLWNDFMRHNPANPGWFNRDRFILSNGHGSMLLYSLLHLSGYDLTIEDIKQFRRLHSKTPGHPEHGLTPGVETTTGPLGQGLANAVGMALAEKMLAARFNRDGFNLVDHFTYVFAGDGCLMEGISHECCSLAGTLGLGKLILFYDDNGISIDGPVDAWFSDDTPKRFEAYGWHVVRDVDGHNPDAIKRAIIEARAQTLKPSIICCRTVIGCGAPNACGKASCHGAPLGQDEIAAARERLAWPYEPFVIPEDIYAGWDAREKGARMEQQWNEMLAAYRKSYPELALEFERRIAGKLPESFSGQAVEFIKDIEAAGRDMATRKASQEAIGRYASYLPELVGGSADLTSSNLTNWSGTRPVRPASDFDGNYVHYGVREFAMAAMMNGMALHGGFIPYGGTFLVFSDYARNAMRMSALMKLRVIYVLTHDSIGTGEDGPTHQPVEHIASLRLIPGMSLWRPADAVETAVAWQAAIENENGPTCLILSRQTLPHIERQPEQMENIARGAYVLRDCQGRPEAIIIATGSEVGLALAAALELDRMGHPIRVVSMPSVDRFEAQDSEYREAVLPSDVARRVVVEAGHTGCWHRYAGSRGRVIGIDSFGKSGPGNELFKHFGFEVQPIVDTVLKVIQGI